MDTKSIYIIDDDKIYVKLMLRLLKLNGFNDGIMVFENAKIASEHFNKNQDDGESIVLLDINMPQMNGWEFLDNYIPDNNMMTNKMQLYLVSSSIHEVDRSLAKKYSLIKGFISKPMDKENFNKIFL